MSLIHLHLLLNHLPVIGIPLAGGFLAWGIVKQERVLQRTAFGVLLFLAIMTIPVYLTGEPAEDAVEDLPGVTEAAIERHEDLAQVGFALTQLLGTVGLAALFFSRGKRPLPRSVLYAGAAITVVTAGILAPIAYMGGQIRHTEIGNVAGVEREMDPDQAAATGGRKGISAIR